MGVTPSHRMHHSTTLHESVLYIFGGCDEKASSKNSLFVLDTTTRQWSRPALRGPSPAHRHGHTATMVENRLFVFGGMNRHGRFNDVHVLDLETLTVGREQATGDDCVFYGAVCILCVLSVCVVCVCMCMCP
jgi:N-acetylneuraminic acid mutarotase